MNVSLTSPAFFAADTEQRFGWLLTQERIDLLAFLLVKAESIFDLADPGCLSAERAACLLTDLRKQVCAAGAHDPFPDRPLGPRFEETEIVGKSRNSPSGGLERAS